MNDLPGVEVPSGAPAPLECVDGYLPLEDHGLIGDGSTAALVARDGTIPWLCVPRFDSEPLFCSLLDRERGGHLLVAPEDLRASRQWYEPDSAVLVTELHTVDGVARVTDCLALRSGAVLAEDVVAGRGELLRLVEVVHGSVRLGIEVEPRGGGEADRRSDGLRVRCARQPDLDLQLWSDRQLDGLRATIDLSQGERMALALRWSGGNVRRRTEDPEQLVAQTTSSWRSWLDDLHYDGPQAGLVRRSALTLKLLDVADSGAIVAAPTSSLPERIGGIRNWDYRYAWIRDAAFAVYALRRVELHSEAWGFLGWALDAFSRDERVGVMYTIDGGAVPAEHEDGELEGYRRSSPVRWGNAAAYQRQHDAYGEVLDCAYQWVSGGGSLDPTLWEQLRSLVERARDRWREPDQSIWEVRTSGHAFTYSAAMCHVALDRGANLTEALGMDGDVAGWRREAKEIHRAILEEAWDDDRKAITGRLDPGGGLDASVLALPLRRVVDARHPKMVATVNSVVEQLGVGEGLLRRYLPEEEDDGIGGGEGAFLLCGFWLVDNLAHQGRLDEAHRIYESLCDRANPLGLLPEQVDPRTGAFLGNYPQGFSHVGVISSGINLARHSGSFHSPRGGQHSS